MKFNNKMQAKRRYVYLILSCAFLVYCYYGRYHLKSDLVHKSLRNQLPSFATLEELSEAPLQEQRKPHWVKKSCRMETCFDFSKCRNDPKIYVYPTDGPVSASYRKVLSVLRDSHYTTRDPNEACIFVPAVDTLDGDPLSPDYVPDVGTRLSRLPYWKNGRNHLIFNLYAGTWPDYAEGSLGFNPGEAILARASASETIFRDGFDVSLPLFHKEHPERGGVPPAATANPFPAPRRHLLAFKGKRYVHGIGSETRNSLWHLHDGINLILVTTCRHGKSWKDLRDERCDEDNKEYDKFDYEQLLANSTFCLVARGRRLGSYRFLESLAAGCVPVLLSNGWRLPFDERIDWRRAVVWADERLLLQVPELVRSVTPERVLALRQQTQFLWEQYFSSIEKIVFTTIEILVERVLAHKTSRQREALIWNAYPGALGTLTDYGDSRAHLPIGLGAPPAPLPEPSLPVSSPPPTPGNTFTALLYVQTTSPALHKLLANIAGSEFCEKVVLVWDSVRAAPALKWLTRAAGDSRGPLPVLVIDATTHYPGFPVVGMGVLVWVECVVTEPSYFKLCTEHCPVHLALLDEVASCHQLLHHRLLRLLVQLFESPQDELEILVQLELKKMLLDRMVNLLSRGCVVPVLRYVKQCWQRGDTDISLIRYFITEVLDAIAPPYTPEFVQLVLPMVENEEITGTMRAEGENDPVSEFIVHCKAHYAAV